MSEGYPTEVPWWSLWSFVASGLAAFGFALLSDYASDGFPEWARQPLFVAVFIGVAMIFWSASLFLLTLTAKLLRPWRPLEAIPAHVELTGIQAAVSSMGFVSEPVALQPHGAVLICYPHPSRRTWAIVTVTQGQLALEYVSFLNRGFTLCTQQHPARLPGFERNLTQAFPRLYPDQLLWQHEQSLSWLDGRGWNARAVKPGALPAQLERCHRAGAVVRARRLLRSTAVVLWRSLTGRGPHERPIAEQPGVLKALSEASGVAAGMTPEIQ